MFSKQSKSGWLSDKLSELDILIDNTSNNIVNISNDLAKRKIPNAQQKEKQDIYEQQIKDIVNFHLQIAQLQEQVQAMTDSLESTESLISKLESDLQQVTQERNNAMLFRQQMQQPQQMGIMQPDNTIIKNKVDVLYNTLSNFDNTLSNWDVRLRNTNIQLANELRVAKTTREIKKAQVDNLRDKMKELLHVREELRGAIAT